MLYLVLFCSAIAYLLGSINTSIIVSKVMGKGDIRNSGSGNAGATNTLRVLGKGAAVAVLIGDILKGVIAILIAKFAYRYFNVSGDEMIAQCFAALFVIIGHIYPLYFGFKGGKGILVSVTALMFANWKIALAILIISILVMAITKYVSLGSMLGAILFIVLPLIFETDNIPYLIFCIILAVLAIYKHRSNIVRLIKGEESKLTSKKK